MRDLLALVLIVGLIGSGGCSSSKPILDCSKRPDPGKLDNAERAALGDSLARYGERCRRPDTQCEISLIRNTRGEILVTVASIHPHRDSGQCLQIPGDQDLAVYSPDGAFIRRVMSL